MMKRIDSKKMEIAVKYKKTLQEVAAEYDVTPTYDCFMQFLRNKGFSKSSAKYYTNCLKANSDAAAKRTSKVKAKTEVEVTTTVATEISEEKIEINSVDEMFEVFEKNEASNYAVIIAAEEFALNFEITADEINKQIVESEQEFKVTLSEINQLIAEIHKKKEKLKSTVINKDNLNKQLNTVKATISTVHEACEHRRKEYEKERSILIIDEDSVDSCSNSTYGKIFLVRDLLAGDCMAEKIADIQNKIMQYDFAEDFTVKQLKLYAKYLSVVRTVQEKYTNAVVDNTFTGIDQLVFDQLLSTIN